MKTAFCLFEASGTMANLLKEKGFNVVAVDKKLGVDIFDFDYKHYSNVEIIISHPPCTEFSGSGACWWPKKDLETPWKKEQAINNVKKVLEIVEFHKPRIWFIENPVGRIESCVPELKTVFKWNFDPFEFAGFSSNPELEAYTKKTILWGKFKIPKKSPVEPIRSKNGHHSLDMCLEANGIKLPPIGQRNEIRSKTPEGFAKAFVNANYNAVLAEQLTIF